MFVAAVVGSVAGIFSGIIGMFGWTVRWVVWLVSDGFLVMVFGTGGITVIRFVAIVVVVVTVDIVLGTRVKDCLRGGR